MNDTFAGTSDEMFTKFSSGGGGQYDLASFSGDASLRAIKSGVGRPSSTRSKLTNYKDLAKQLQSPSFNTEDGKHYGLSFMWGANVLIYNADKVKPRRIRWNVHLRPQVQGQGHRPEQPDPDRGPGAAVLRRRRTRTRSTRRRSTRSRTKLQDQKPLVRKYWVLATDFEDLFKSGEATVGAGWPLMTNDLRKAGLNVKEVLPEGGRDRVVGLLDALQERQAPDLRLQVHELRHEPESQAKVVDGDELQPREPEDL